MAKWVNLKSAVAAVVKTNGNKEITGANMQAVLNSIINAVGGNAGFAGIAIPTTNPSGIPDGPTFYIATQGGTYSYFPTDGQSTPATIQDGVISVLYNQGNGLWAVTATPMSIADGSVTTGKLATGAVTGAKITDGAVTEYKLGDNSVSIRSIKDGAVTTPKLYNGAVTNEKIANETITAAKIADGAVGNQQLAANSVTAEKIGDGSITTSKISTGAVTGEKIANGTITSAKIADGTITANEIAPNSIESSNLGYGAVDNEILADGAVTTGKIANKAVTKGKLDDDVVAILDEVDNKANVDGFYDTMGVGTARNLLGKTSVVDTFFRKIIGVGVAKGNGYVDEVRGNSVAWNQLYLYGGTTNPSPSNGTLSVDNITRQYEYTITTIGSNMWDNRIALFPEKVFIDGHKYFVIFSIKPKTTNKIGVSGNSLYRNIYYDNLIANDWNKVELIYNSEGYTGNQLWINLNCGTGYSVGDNILVKDFQLIDLTENNIDTLTTIDEVEAWLASNAGKADYYAYDAGSLLSVKMQNVKTVGFNRWDEQWEVGGLTQEMPNDRIRSKNYIPVIPSSTLYITTNANVAQYNADNELIGYGSNGSSSVPTYQSGEFIINSQAKYIKFNTGGAYGNTYNHDICINFSNSGLNGTYMPYQTQTKALPVTTLTGNHLGTRSTIFPNGMRGVGNGYDEISGNSAIVRIASVKVSELEWVFVDTNVFVANIPTRKYGNGIIVMCDKYASQARGVDKGIYAHTITNSVLITDTAYQSVAAFKAAMGDATILFELAEPIEYTDLQDEEENDFSLPIGIEVEPLGTLETLPQNTDGEALTVCAPTLSMKFSIDAAKILTDELPNEYRTNADDKANWQKFLALMNEKLGSTMGGTISVYDTAVGHGLDFTFAAAQAENNRDVEPIEE